MSNGQIIALRQMNNNKVQDQDTRKGLTIETVTETETETKTETKTKTETETKTKTKTERKEDRVGDRVRSSMTGGAIEK